MLIWTTACFVTGVACLPKHEGFHRPDPPIQQQLVGLRIDKGHIYVDHVHDTSSRERFTTNLQRNMRKAAQGKTIFKNTLFSDAVGQKLYWKKYCRRTIVSYKLGAFKRAVLGEIIFLSSQKTFYQLAMRVQKK